MDEDELDDFAPRPIPARRFRLLDLVILVLDTLTGLGDDLNRMLMSHANWKTQRQRFADEARAEIEAIVNGE